MIDIFLSSGDTYLSFGVSLSNPIFSVSLSTVFELFCGEIFETFMILMAILLPIISGNASAVFVIALWKQF